MRCSCNISGDIVIWFFPSWNVIVSCPMIRTPDGSGTGTRRPASVSTSDWRKGPRPTSWLSSVDIV